MTNICMITLKRLNGITSTMFLINKWAKIIHKRHKFWWINWKYKLRKWSAIDKADCKMQIKMASKSMNKTAN